MDMIRKKEKNLATLNSFFISFMYYSLAFTSSFRSSQGYGVVDIYAAKRKSEITSCSASL